MGAEGAGITARERTHRIRLHDERRTSSRIPRRVSAIASPDGSDTPPPDAHRAGCGTAGVESRRTPRGADVRLVDRARERRRERPPQDRPPRRSASTARLRGRRAAASPSCARSTQAATRAWWWPTVTASRQRTILRVCDEPKDGPVWSTGRPQHLAARRLQVRPGSSAPCQVVDAATGRHAQRALPPHCVTVPIPAPTFELGRVRRREQGRGGRADMFSELWLLRPGHSRVIAAAGGRRVPRVES